MRTMKWAAVAAVAAFAIIAQPGVLRAAGNGDDAVTMWVAIFNVPGACVDGCGADDLRREGVDGSVAYVTGQRVQSNGRASFAGSLGEGSLTGVLFGPGLVDADGAEIHPIIRTHGRVLEDFLTAQVSSVNGGCPPNTCVDVQFAIHDPSDAVGGVSTSEVRRFVDRSVVKDALSTLMRFGDGIIVVVNTRL